jgi:hypothetical protein
MSLLRKLYVVDWALHIINIDVFFLYRYINIDV